jgi:hypothetical protein
VADVNVIYLRRLSLDERSLNINTFSADYVLILRGMPFPKKRNALLFTEPELRKL